MPGGLHPVDVGLQRNHELRPIAFHCDGVLILHLDPLGAKSRNRNDAGRELLVSPGFARVVLAHLQQPGVDGLGLRLRVDFACAAPFQDHAGDAGDVVPHREAGDRRLVRKRKSVNALLNGRAVVAEDLS